MPLDIHHRILWVVLPGLLTTCGRKNEATAGRDSETKPIFRLLSPDSTRIRFNNAITETPYANIFSYQYFYNGGGVAIADLNGDSLQDIYFSGNQVENKLYLNRGNMKFEDVTAYAGVPGTANSWKTGVAIADVNADGRPDIYQCYSGPLPGSSRKNQLLINEGNDTYGIPVFRDRADAFGLADSSFSTHASFFDYDLDGDLDLFLLNHNPAPFNNLDDITIREIMKKPEPNMHSKLFRNEGGRFTDISVQAGLNNSAFSYGLGVGVSDFNNDGWPDIYVCNDYSAPDYFLVNNKNGTFTDRLKSSMEHTSLYSMGTDIADMNNDGLADIMVLDMLPEDNRRQKLLFGPDNYEYFEMIVRAGFHHQYMRNMLQLNNGDGTFSEIGQLSGVSNTDWSWAPLMADFDNDGWKDLFVSNGFLKDFTNLDFIKYRSDYFQYLNGKVTPESVREVLSKMPSSNVKNYLFQNEGNLQFKNRSEQWGLKEASNSNGAAYGDLDNDGDLDLVVNNINLPAFIYQNKSEELKRHWLKIKMVGPAQNREGIGSKIILFSKGQQQLAEQMPSRGYQSAVSPVLHFGLGDHSLVDSLLVTWPGGKQQRLYNIKANQVLVMEEGQAKEKSPGPAMVKPYFTETPPPFPFTHQPTQVNDFKRQPLMINPQSFSGPCMAKADVNGDGLEDVFVGGAAGQAAVLYLQQKSSAFVPASGRSFEADQSSEDVDAVFVDVNSDKAPDLYVASGGYHHFLPQDQVLQDRLYLNDGKGNFVKMAASLPVMLTSTGCVKAGDVNGDGAPDLFIGGRVVPGRYPEIPRSYLLLNDGHGRFSDQTQALAKALERVGMVTDAAWFDLDGDHKNELVVVGEWMPVMIFRNTNGKLVDATEKYFEKRYSGWWNRLLIGDFNKDNRPDLVIGNQGLNTQCKASDKEPADLYFKDFDENGAVDPVLCFYIQGKSYPYLTRDELLDQVSMMRTRYQDYAGYADVEYKDLFTAEEREGAGHLSANFLQTAYFQGGEDGKFHERKLPLEVQFSPVFAIKALDYNGDGSMDLVLGGNINKARLRFGKSNANHGILLQGDGNGNFRYVPQTQSGLQLNGDVRSILHVKNYLLFGINGMPLKSYKMP